jgi:hypothetical protein
MFGSRWFGAKLVAAFGVFAACAAVAHLRGVWINPAPHRAELLAPRHDGDILWLPLADVVEEGVIEYAEKRYPVTGATLRPGDRVELSARFRSNPARLEILEVRRVKFAWWRDLANVVSLVVLAAVLLVFFRRFRVRPGSWEARWPTS